MFIQLLTHTAPFHPDLENQSCSFFLIITCQYIFRGISIYTACSAFSISPWFENNSSLWLSKISPDGYILTILNSSSSDDAFSKSGKNKGSAIFPQRFFISRTQEDIALLHVVWILSFSSSVQLRAHWFLCPNVQPAADAPGHGVASEGIFSVSSFHGIPGFLSFSIQIGRNCSSAECQLSISQLPLVLHENLQKVSSASRPSL